MIVKKSIPGRIKPNYVLAVFGLALCYPPYSIGQTTAPPTQAMQAEADLGAVMISAKRAQRLSQGATGLLLDIKETPQTITQVNANDIRHYQATTSTEALQLVTGLNVEPWETNRTSFNARGFDVQLTQIDGQGMSNDWGIATGHQDAYVFDKIEVVRGANGLLTGVGNVAGTINYVRKRPKSEDGGEWQVSGGNYGLKRVASDLNKVLTQDRRWAMRWVLAHEDKGSYLRNLRNKKSTVYAVVDGQLGDRGVLTLGLSQQRARQYAPMWGSLTLHRGDGSRAEFPVSASTAMNWAHWNQDTSHAFLEYNHQLGDSWEAKLGAHVRRVSDHALLFLAYPGPSLRADNTGLLGRPSNGFTRTRNVVVDANVNGGFEIFGRQHELRAGISHSVQNTVSELMEYDKARYFGMPMPAFPFAGHEYPEPIWGARVPRSDSKQTMTRVYGASRWSLTEQAKGFLGLNVVSLRRVGANIVNGNRKEHGYRALRKFSPYVGLTYALTPELLSYFSHSAIALQQEQVDINGRHLDPVLGVNTEVGIKSEWLDRRLLATMAVFRAQQRGVATYAGLGPDRRIFYSPQNLATQGLELEVSGKLSPSTQITLGYTKLNLPNLRDPAQFSWIPRTVINARLDSKIAGAPQWHVGLSGRWQSSVSNKHGVKQPAYALLHAFARYAINSQASLQFNVQNVLNKKYLQGLQWGAIYGAPRQAALTFEYQF